MRTHILHRDPKGKLFDKIVLMVAIVAPLTSIAQIWQIIDEKNAAGVSVISWGLQAVFAFILFLYGISRRDKTITILYALWTTLDTAVVLAALAFP